MSTTAILSVLGEDQVGIVSTVSQVLADERVNIEDIRQSIIGGIFSMTMLVTLDDAHNDIETLQKRLAQAAEELGIQVTLQREDVFRFMHRI